MLRGMGRSSLLAALVATGCSFGGAAGDAGTDDSVDDSSVDDGPPDSNRPPDAAVDGSVEGDAASVDTDGDGYPDGADNCPNVGQMDQRNHDGDLLGDVCDPCPHLTSNTDTDEDGVGDACDPRPGMAGDTQLAFYGFDDGSVDLSTWPQAGSWSVAGGRLVLATPASGSQYISLPDTPGTVYLMAGVEVDVTRQPLSRVGIVVGQQGTFPGIDRYYACETDRGVGGLDWNAYAQWDGDMPLDFNQGGTLGPGGAGTLVTYSILLSSDAFECRWASGGNSQGSLVSPIGELGDRITIGTQTEGLASFDYVFLAKPGG